MAHFTRFSLASSTGFCLWVAAATCLVDQACSQSRVRGWAARSFDTASREGRVVQIDASYLSSVLLRSDGRVFLQGAGHDQSAPFPAPPAGTRYVQVGVGEHFGIGLLSNGTLVSAGQITPGSSIPPAVPVAPPGLRFDSLAVGPYHALALRSDGHLVAWGHNALGECNVPAIAPGLVFSDIEAGGLFSMAQLSDGTILTWGHPLVSAVAVPPLPVGLQYVAMAAAGYCAMALRSDGELAAWGDNTWGQCNVPPLPPGTRYTTMAGGLAHAVAVRSDGVLVGWGQNWLGDLDLPAIPQGDRCVQIACGDNHTMILLASGRVLSCGYEGHMQSYLPRLKKDQRFVDVSAGTYHVIATLSDGRLEGWGQNDYGQSDPPPPPAGAKFVRAEAGYTFSTGLLDNGNIVVWGNTLPQLTVPALPAGVVYTDFATSCCHVVAIRSDGQAVAWGDNNFGCLNLPALPAGMRYVDCDAQYGRTLLLRSDDACFYVGMNASNPYANPPAPLLPGGVHWAQVALSQLLMWGLRSDGDIVGWGGPIPTPVPALPWGTYYVEVDGGQSLVLMRRSDGQVFAAGTLQGQDIVPPLEPGTSYVQVTASSDVLTVARVGPTSTFVSYGHGCAGSLPASRAVPDDTPRIGKTLHVTFFDLPQNLAILAFGWNKSSPLDLTFVGMPGCDLHVDPAAYVALVGQDQQAVWDVPIPDDPQFVGVHFFGQSLVLDPAAGNGFGAVLSDAAEGVIGHW